MMETGHHHCEEWKDVHKNIRIKGKLEVCGDATIKGKLTAAVAEIANAKIGTLEVGNVVVVKDPWEGWWGRVTKGMFTPASFPFGQYFQVKKISESQYQFTSCAGSINIPFNYQDPLPTFIMDKLNDQVLYLPLEDSYTATVDGVSGTYVNKVNIYMTKQLPETLVDENSNIAPGEQQVYQYQFEDPGLNSLKFTLSWEQLETDLDLYIYDSNFNLVGQGATLANPEIVTVNVSNITTRPLVYYALIHSYSGPNTAFNLNIGGSFAAPGLDNLIYFQGGTGETVEREPGLLQGPVYAQFPENVTPEDDIRPFENLDNKLPDLNSVKYMFQQVDDIFFGNNYPSLAPFGESERNMVQPKRNALKDKILSKGVKRPNVPIYEIYKTTKNSGTTTILVKGYQHNLNFASDVTIEGLQGEGWQDLNGKTYQLCGVYNTWPGTYSGESPFVAAESWIYYIQLILDTSSFPDVVLNGCNSYLKPNKIIITEDISYRRFVDAAIYYIFSVVKSSTHASFLSFLPRNNPPILFNSIETINTKTSFESWKDVNNALQNLVNLNAYSRTVLFKPNYYLEAAMYYYPVLSAGNIPLNQPFKELGVTLYDQNIIPEYVRGTLPAFGFIPSLYNYVLPETRRWLYFRVKPNTPVTNEKQKNVWVLGYNSDGSLNPLLRGYASVGPNGLNTNGQLGGSRLEGLMSPVPWGTEDPELAAGFWSPFVRDPANTFPDDIRCGLVDPAITHGKRIVVFGIFYNLLADPRGISLDEDFGNPTFATSPDPAVQKRQRYDGQRAVISEVGKYLFTELKADAINWDNRQNQGHFVNFPLVEMIGGVRKGVTDIVSFQNQDSRNPINLHTDIVQYCGINQNTLEIQKQVDASPFVELRPDLMEKDYPGSTFSNGPLIFLQSILASSGGCQLPRFFIGDNHDGNIGNGVQTRMVSNMDAILDGYSGGSTPLLISKYGSILKDASGNGVSPVTIAPENLLYNNIQGAPTSTRLEPDGSPIPAMVPVNTNLRGPIYTNPNNNGEIKLVQGPLSSNVPDTIYFDFGYTGPGNATDGTPYTAGHWNNPPTGLGQTISPDGSLFPAQPDPTKLESLRDSIFEESLRVTLLELGALKVGEVVKEKVSLQTRKVSHHHYHQHRQHLSKMTPEQLVELNETRQKLAESHHSNSHLQKNLSSRQKLNL